MDSGVSEVAKALLSARRSGKVADTEPLLEALQGAEDAYAVQSLVAAQLRWHSGPVANYWKSGGASREIGRAHV